MSAALPETAITDALEGYRDAILEELAVAGLRAHIVGDLRAQLKIRRAVGPRPIRNATGDRSDLQSRTQMLFSRVADESRTYMQGYLAELRDTGGCTIKGEHVPWLDRRIETTREDAAATIERGIEEGMSRPRLAAELASSLAGTKFELERISHTEMARIEAAGARARYEAAEIEEAQWNTGPTPCDDCAAYSGQIYRLDELPDEIPVHPFCACDLVPIITIPPDEDTLLDEEELEALLAMIDQGEIDPESFMGVPEPVEIPEHAGTTQSSFDDFFSPEVETPPPTLPDLEPEPPAGEEPAAPTYDPGPGRGITDGWVIYDNNPYLTAEERALVYDYQKENLYGIINPMLREPEIYAGNPAFAKYAAKADQLIEAVSQNRVPEDCITHRGTTVEALQAMGAMAEDGSITSGTSFFDKGFASFSTNDFEAQKFAHREAEPGDPAYVIICDTPAGSAGLYVDPEEHEIIRPPGTTFEVLQVDEDYASVKGTQIVAIYVREIPPEDPAPEPAPAVEEPAPPAPEPAPEPKDFDRPNLGLSPEQVEGFTPSQENPALNGEMRYSLNQYQWHGLDQQANTLLREPQIFNARFPDADREWVEGQSQFLQTILEKNEVPVDCVTYRGTCADDLRSLGVLLEDGTIPQGVTFKDPGFASYTLNDRTAENFAEDKTQAGEMIYVLVADTPAGSPGIYLDAKEHEVLRPAGTNFEILEVDPNFGTAGGNQVCAIYVREVGLEPSAPAPEEPAPPTPEPEPEPAPAPKEPEPADDIDPEDEDFEGRDYAYAYGSTGEAAAEGWTTYQENDAFTEDQRERILEYQWQGLDEEVNGLLRYPETFQPQIYDSTELVEKALELQQIVSTNQIERDCITYRGTDYDALKALGIVGEDGTITAGATFHDKGFPSFSLDDTTAVKFGMNKAGETNAEEIYVLIAETKAGSPGIFLDRDEYEILRPARTEFEILQTEQIGVYDGIPVMGIYIREVPAEEEQPGPPAVEPTPAAPEPEPTPAAEQTVPVSEMEPVAPSDPAWFGYIPDKEKDELMRTLEADPAWGPRFIDRYYAGEIDADQREALRIWQSHEYSTVNEYAREGSFDKGRAEQRFFFKDDEAQAAYEAEIAKVCQTLDRTIAERTIPADYELYRGVSYGYQDILYTAEIGDTYAEGQYQAFSHVPNTSLGFTGKVEAEPGLGVVLRTTTTGDQNAFWMGGGETEVIFGRDAEWRIIDKNIVEVETPNGDTRRVLVVDVEPIPAAPEPSAPAPEEPAPPTPEPEPEPAPAVEEPGPPPVEPIPKIPEPAEEQAPTSVRDLVPLEPGDEGYTPYMTRGEANIYGNTLREDGRWTSAQEARKAGTIDAGEYEALEVWGESYYADIQDYLWSDQAPLPENLAYWETQLQEWVGQLDSTLNKSEMPGGFELLRGVDEKSAAQLITANVGGTYSEKGYQSWSLDSNAPLDFTTASEDAPDFRVILRTTSEEGDSGLFLANGVNEVLLPRDSEWRIMDRNVVEWDLPDGTTQKVLIVDVERASLEPPTVEEPTTAAPEPEVSPPEQPPEPSPEPKQYWNDGTWTEYITSDDLIDYHFNPALEGQTDVQAIIGDYQHEGLDTRMNAILRDPAGALFAERYPDENPYEYTERILALQETLVQAEIPVDCVTYRGTAPGPLQAIGAMAEDGRLEAGTVFKDPGFASYSLDDQRAVMFGLGERREGDPIYVIVNDTKAGASGLYLDEYEHEVLRPAGTSLEILEVDQNFGKFGDIPVYGIYVREVDEPDRTPAEPEPPAVEEPVTVQEATPPEKGEPIPLEPRDYAVDHTPPTIHDDFVNAIDNPVIQDRPEFLEIIADYQGRGLDLDMNAYLRDPAEFIKSMPADEAAPIIEKATALNTLLRDEATVPVSCITYRGTTLEDLELIDAVQADGTITPGTVFYDKGMPSFTLDDRTAVNFGVEKAEDSDDGRAYVIIAATEAGSPGLYLNNAESEILRPSNTPFEVLAVDENFGRYGDTQIVAIYVRETDPPEWLR